MYLKIKNNSSAKICAERKDWMEIQLQKELEGVFSCVFHIFYYYV